MLTTPIATELAAVNDPAGPGSDDDFAEAVATLHTRTVDVMAGYVKMVEKAEPDFRPIAEQFVALHARQADTLARMLAGLGRSAEPDGSFMATVNKAVVGIRALFDEIDGDVMDSVRRGEQHVLAGFDDALRHETRAADAQVLREMRDELVALLDATRHID